MDPEKIEGVFFIHAFVERGQGFEIMGGKERFIHRGKSPALGFQKSH